MSVYSMLCEDLETWVKTKAKPGDVAYWYDRRHEQAYFYFYKGPDLNPCWQMWFKDEIIDTYLEEINKLKIEEPKMNKRCDNCKYFGSYTYKDGIGGSWCNHEKHKGMLVSNFTSCPEHEHRETKSTPFGGMKFYLKDQTTGELGIKYVCEDCGKIMDEPGHWRFIIPTGLYGKPNKNPGFQFRCEECEKRREGKR